MKATDKVLTLLEVVADMTASEWYQVSHAINQMFKRKIVSMASKVKLEDTEAMKQAFLNGLLRDNLNEHGVKSK